jgi:hypothetical protein
MNDSVTEQLWRLWEQGQRPDVNTLLDKAGPLSPAQVAVVLRADQRHRWPVGERVPVEKYLQDHPELHADPDGAIDLIFNEYLLREKQGERPDPSEFMQRFPEYAAVLQAQIELHQALAAGSNGSSLAGVPGHDVTDTKQGEDGQSSIGSVVHSPRSGATATDHGPRSADAPPAEFGRYRIRKLLGKGAMGAVYLALDTRLDRLVALKVPHLQDDRDGVLIERFYREARIAATFNHPHLCPVYDFGRIDGIHYLSMPFLEGESLAGRIRRAGPLPARNAAQVAFLVARGLAVAHAAGFIHRDMKPANVMLTATGEPVVMDFGLARTAASEDERLTVTGIVVGTPAYLAPEQIGADPDNLGPAGDIYSLGVTLYEMLTGRVPFQGPMHSLLRQVLVHDPEPPSRHCPDLDSRLEAICLKAMARDPQARFTSMEALAATLDDYLHDRPQTLASPSPVVRRKSLLLRTTDYGVRTAQRKIGLTIITLVLLAGAAGFVLWLQSAPADLLQAGSRWEGVFRFTGRFEGHTGDVRIDITDRTGERVEGVYSTEGGKWQWRVEGTARDGALRLDFTGIIREPEPRNLVGKGYIDGTYQGRRLDVVFHNPNMDGTAEMKLWLNGVAE